MVNNRIYQSFTRPSREWVELFRGIPTANIADEMNRLSCLDAGMRPYNRRALLGVALTVKSVANDNLMFHKAIAMAHTGDVIVVDGEGSLQHAMCGEFMFRGAMNKGIQGFVVDGAIRDCQVLEELDFSVYARGVQPKGPYKNGPGEINVPVSVGGLVIEPGDILVGDMDGLVVIRPGDAEELAVRARAKFDQEQASLQEMIAAGRRVVDRAEPSFTDEALLRQGCEMIEGGWR